jgi:DNA-binding NarL/FixJ family response regulator
MIEVLIIDKTNQIKPALSSVVAAVESFDDEVKALNAVEGRSSPVILLNYNIMQEQTAEYVSLLLKASLDSKIVVIAEKLGEKEVLSCLLGGAKGYQQLNQLSDYAERLVTVMDAGEAWITRRMTSTLIDSLRKR